MAQFIGGAPRAPRSPSVAVPIGANGLRGAITGVTRIGSRAGLLVMGIVGLLVLAIVYGLSTSGTHRAAAADVAALTPQILPTSGPLFDDIPGANAAAVPRLPQSPPRPAPVARRPAARSAAAGVPVLPDPATQPALVRTTVPDIAPVAPAQNTLAAVREPARMDQAAALRAQRAAIAAQLADQARHAGIIVGAPAAAGSGVAAAPPAAAPAAAAPIAIATPSAAPAAATVVDDPATAAQQAKAQFVAAQKSTVAADYATTPRQSAISPYEVQAGSIIPAILITGVNSDLPGTMIGQVSQNVYDSKTGQYLLIPAGAKIVGRYDSQVSNGQSRVLVAWNRIIFPDTSFIDINGMAGSDTAGYSGFTGKVDDHSGKLFKNAILFSLIGAGATLLQPRTLTALTPVGAVVQAPSVASQVAGQVGNGVAQLAQQSTQRGLQQQPTIEVRPGYLFNIMVDRDLVLPGPYKRD